MRRKDKSKTEHLRGEIRELTSELKRLRQKLRKYEKYEDLEEVPIFEEKKTPRCPKCRSVDIKQISIEGIRTIDECPDCGYRQVRKWNET